MNKVQSANNKLIKLAKNISSDKKYRDSTNMFICETYRIVDTLIKQNYKLINVLITNDSKYFNEFKTNPNTRTIDSQSFRSISNLKNSDGVLAIFEKQNKEINISNKGKYLILNKIQNPGNLGTIIRTACAFNVDGIYITNDSVDLYHPETIRQTMGYMGLIPIKVYHNYFDVIDLMHKNNIKVYATALNEKSIDVNKVKLSNSLAIVFGNEGNGLNHKEIRVCDASLFIKTNRRVQSLNVAIAVGIILSKLD